MRASRENSSAARACDRLTEGKFSRNSDSGSPAARQSKRVLTGTRVPTKTGMPLMISGSEWTMRFVLAMSDSFYQGSWPPIGEGLECLRGSADYQLLRSSSKGSICKVI